MVQKPSLVLLVEDSVTQAEYFRDILEELSFEVQVAGDGQAALELAHEILPDLVILDVNLPKLSGLQVCARLTRDEKTRDIPVIILTERNTPEDAIQSYDSGASKFITKNDFATDVLISGLEQLGFVTS